MAGNLTFVDSNLEGNICSETNELAEHLGRLMRDEETCDVLFIVGENKQNFKAHSLILKARCENFHEHWPPTNGSPFIIKYERFRPAVFKKVLEYIYTGKMMFTAGCTMESLKIAQHLKIPGLVTASENFLVEHLSAANCCEFFMDALSAFSIDECEQYGKNLVSKCQMFIGENAAMVIQTNGFLNLSKDALIKLISSDQFALPEEEVWYAVLNWAKNQAKVKGTVHNWTDNERRNVCKYLSDVIGYVRVLLIDSKIFAEQIEPTGAVPIELSLQRYRYAAVPDTFHGNDDCRRRRVQYKLFQESSILQKENIKLQETLNMWFGNEHQQWCLLYQATRDGFSAKTFHEKCDGVGPTYTLVKGLNGNICGGFTDMLWMSKAGNGKYFASDRSFVFTLVNSHGVQPTKFGILRPKYAILCHISLGPTFGAGADLCISDQCNTNMDSYSNLPHSYVANIALDNLLMGEREFKVANYEVYCPIIEKTKAM